MQKIEFTQGVKFGDVVIDEITVAPLAFHELAAMWATMTHIRKGFSKALQRARIAKQTTFKAKGEVVVAKPENLTALPVVVAKSIIAQLDVDQGEGGEVIGDGDGITAPVLYRLGTPIKMKDGGGNDLVIEELEFFAKTFGEVEDVMAANSDVERAMILIRDLAVPVGMPTMQRLPAWAADRITIADGVVISGEIASRF